MKVVFGLKVCNSPCCKELVCSSTDLGVQWVRLFCRPSECLRSWLWCRPRRGPWGPNKASHGCHHLWGRTAIYSIFGCELGLLSKNWFIFVAMQPERRQYQPSRAQGRNMFSLHHSTSCRTLGMTSLNKCLKFRSRPTRQPPLLPRSYHFASEESSSGTKKIYPFTHHSGFEKIQWKDWIEKHQRVTTS